jgi:hypothetical protein
MRLVGTIECAAQWGISSGSVERSTWPYVAPFRRPKFLRSEMSLQAL